MNAQVNLSDWDCFSFADFNLGTVYVIRRDEWIEPNTFSDASLVGRNGVEQRFGNIGIETMSDHVVTVDAGLSFLSLTGAELRLDADTFPLVFQLRYVVASSLLPDGSKFNFNVVPVSG